MLLAEEKHFAILCSDFNLQRTNNVKMIKTHSFTLDFVESYLFFIIWKRSTYRNDYEVEPQDEAFSMSHEFRG